MRVKYVIMDNLGQGAFTQGPVLFPEFETHARVVDKYGGKSHVVSAGFVEVFVEDEELHVRCYGGATSIGVKSAPVHDARQIRRMFCEDY